MKYLLILVCLKVLLALSQVVFGLVGSCLLVVLKIFGIDLSASVCVCPTKHLNLENRICVVATSPTVCEPVGRRWAQPGHLC